MKQWQESQKVQPRESGFAQKERARGRGGLEELKSVFLSLNIRFGLGCLGDLSQKFVAWGVTSFA